MNAALIALALQVPALPAERAEPLPEAMSDLASWADETALERLAPWCETSRPEERDTCGRGLVRLARRALSAGDCAAAARLARHPGLSQAPPELRAEADEVLAATEAGGQGPSAACAEARVDGLLGRMRAVQDHGLAQWPRFRFRRTVDRQRLTSSGEPKHREVLVFDVRPVAGGFDERLVRRNGSRPSRAEVIEHREARRFEKHWLSLRPGGADEAAAGARFSLGRLLELSDYELAGREISGGEDCWRLDFQPSDGADADGSLAGRLTNAMEGSLWVSVEGSQLVRAEARTAHGVAALAGLAGVKALEVVMEQVEIEPGLRLPGRIEVNSTVRVLLGTQRRRNVYLYSDVEPVTSQ